MRNETLHSATHFRSNIFFQTSWRSICENLSMRRIDINLESAGLASHCFSGRARDTTVLWLCDVHGLSGSSFKVSAEFADESYHLTLLRSQSAAETRCASTSCPHQETNPCDNLAASFDKPRGYLHFRDTATQT